MRAECEPIATFDLTHCLLTNERSIPAAMAPTFALCRNATCISAAYRQKNRAHLLPINASARGDVRDAQYYELGSPGPSRQVPSPITELQCREGLEADEAKVVTQVSSAVARSQPLVLRGCAANMPAISRWLNDTYLRELSPVAFAPILSTYGQGSTSVNTLDHLHPGLVADVWWPSPVGDLLWSFGLSPLARGLWVSAGGTRAAMRAHTTFQPSCRFITHSMEL